VEELRKEMAYLDATLRSEKDDHINNLTEKSKQIKSLEKENAAANKRIEELTAKNLKLLNENNDLWDKVNNPKMKI
jgi:uncharacterized coiled-coil DUF342 family protein